MVVLIPDIPEEVWRLRDVDLTILLLLLAIFRCQVGYGARKPNHSHRYFRLASKKCHSETKGGPELHHKVPMKEGAATIDILHPSMAAAGMPFLQNSQDAKCPDK